MRTLLIRRAAALILLAALGLGCITGCGGNTEPGSGTGSNGTNTAAANPGTGLGPGAFIDPNCTPPALKPEQLQADLGSQRPYEEYQCVVINDGDGGMIWTYTPTGNPNAFPDVSIATWAGAGAMRHLPGLKASSPDLIPDVTRGGDYNNLVPPQGKGLQFSVGIADSSKARLYSITFVYDDQPIDNQRIATIARQLVESGS